jgi:hypothetical protein
VQPLENFPAFYGTRRFITVFTRSLKGLGNDTKDSRVCVALLDEHLKENSEVYTNKMLPVDSRSYATIRKRMLDNEG